MSGEQWGEAVDAAALAMYGVEHLAERYRSVAEAAIAAAAPLIVADTRRKVADELLAESQRIEANYGGVTPASRVLLSAHLFVLGGGDFRAIARGSGNGGTA